MLEQQGYVEPVRSSNDHLNDGRAAQNSWQFPDSPARKIGSGIYGVSLKWR